jgi:translation initiation factor IF-2
MRVHELAKELNLNSKVLVPELIGMGLDVKSHMSSLSEEQAEAVRNKFGGSEPKKASKAGLEKTTVKKVVKKVSKKKEEAAAEKELKEVSEKGSDDEEPSEDKPSDVRVEKRVSGTVIRRRKKVKVESEPQAEVVEEKVEAEAPDVEEKEEKVTVDISRKVSSVAEAEENLEQEISPETGEKLEDRGKTEETAAEEKPVKKKKAKSKPAGARIVGKIDLEPKKDEEEEKAPVAKGEVKPVPGQGEDLSEKGKKVAAKDSKARRKKFKWQGDSVEEEEGAVPRPHKRRYKVGDKASKGRRKPKVSSLADRKLGKSRETEITTPKAIKRKIRVKDEIALAELAKKMGVKATEVMRKLIELGVMATINQVLDLDSASLVASEFNYEVETVSIEEETIFEEKSNDQDEDLIHRCPVVTVMGHVDHGKTSLLDTIRNASVADGEKGGITQHIGAYRVKTGHGDIAFVDTPGHAAFTAMRSRGAQITDIVILVVAAEEGPKPQTLEAINHAKAAGVPIIVAVNKIDKPEANPEKVKQELSNHGLVPEDWGGDAIFIEVSAKQNIGIEKLLEMVILQAEMLELRANPNKSAKGVIVEARMDKGRGPIATVLVQEGTLKPGDAFVSRHNAGKVKALIGDRGEMIKEAGPSTPVEILGFSGVPEAGDAFLVVDDKKARQTSDYWQQKKREVDLKKDAGVSLENFMSAVGEGDKKELRIIVRADVQGSAEALKASLENLTSDEVKLTVLHSSVGAVSLNDVMLAAASNAIIIGFGVKAEAKARISADFENVDIRIYDVIYDVVDEVERAMLGLLPPRIVETKSGKAEVKQAFEISKYGTVAGCMVIEGKILKGSKARVIRNEDIIYEGEVTSLRRFKDDAKEAIAGQDCGIFLGDYDKFQEGDIIESFLVEEIERTSL